MHGVIFLNKNREESICNYIDYLRKNCGLKVSVHPKDSRIFHFFKSFFKYNIHESPYCIHIKSDLNAYEHCIERQYKIINKCKDGSFCGKCYAGVFEFIYPIEFSGEIFGFISVGGYQSENYNEYLKKISHKYTHNYSDLLESYKKLDNIIPDKHRIDTLLLPLCDMFSLLIYENLNKNVQTMEFGLQLEYYLHVHHTEKITVDNICNKFHCSKSYINHYFKKNNGVTIKDYINRLRIENAKQLLKSTKLSIDEISFAVGFSSISYFSKVFKSQNGLSPSSYRKKI